VLKMLSESPAPPQLRGLFLVETPWWEPEGWSAEYAVPDDIAGHLPDVPIFLYHSIDDPEVPFGHLEMYRSRLPGSTAREIAGSEHSFVHGLPELADDIRAVAGEVTGRSLR